MRTATEDVDRSTTGRRVSSSEEILDQAEDLNGLAAPILRSLHWPRVGSLNRGDGDKSLFGSTATSDVRVL